MYIKGFKGSKRFPGSKEGLQVKDLGRSTVPSKGSKQRFQVKDPARSTVPCILKVLSEGSEVPSSGSK